MVRIKKLTFQNFKSVGGKKAVFEFDDSGLTLLRGKNGKGKSTLPSALTFLLYGKNSDLKGGSLSSLSASELINDVNQKELLVYGEFISNGKLFKLTRGLKPNILTLEVDGKDVANLSAKKLDQAYIEKHLLNGISADMFSRIVYLSAKITSQPFYFLTPQKRKAFIEELLDVRLLSTVGDIIKQRKSKSNLDLKNLTLQLDQLERVQRGLESDLEDSLQAYKTAYDAHTELVSTLEATNKELDDVICKNREKLLKIDAKVDSTVDEIAVLEEKIKEYDEKEVLIREASAKLDLAKDRLQEQKNKMTLAKKEYEAEEKIQSKFEACGTCPTVAILTGSSYDLSSYEPLASSYRDEYMILKKDVDSCTEALDDANAVMEGKDELESSLNKLKSNIHKLTLMHTEIQHEIDTSELKKKNILASINNVPIKPTPPLSLETNQEEINSLSLKYDEASEYIESLEGLSTYIKSETVRASLFDVYIPILKRYVTEFVSKFMEEDIASFQIVIEDDFSIQLYKNRKKSQIFKLSEGQKASINMAFLFAFQKLVELKGQINFLVIDEILDISFDKERLLSVLDTLSTMAKEEKNIILISHNPDLDVDMFDTIVEVTSDSMGFTTYTKS